MLEQLKEKVYIANQDLLELSDHPFPWVGVSAIDRATNRMVCIPDGGAVSPGDLTVMDLEGNILEGKEPPVRDAAVHCRLYKAFPEIGSIAHPYLRWCTVFAQLDLPIPTLGTIHANVFASDIPTTYPLPEEVLSDMADIRVADAIEEIYQVIEETPETVPGVLVTCHGAYAFGEDARTAVSNAAAMEEVAFLAYHTLQMDPGIRPMQLGSKCRRKTCKRG